MSALNAPRNTREVFCGGSGYSRKLEIAAGYTIYPGAIAALNQEGKVVPASDTAGLVVVGICETAFSGYAYLRSGTFCLENGSGKDALTVQDIGSLVYLIDDQTVGKNSGNHAVIAGVLRDVKDGQAIVTLGNCPTAFPASAFVKRAETDPELAENVPAGTMLLATKSWSGGTSIAEATAGEIYISNGTNWVKLG